MPMSQAKASLVTPLLTLGLPYQSVVLEPCLSNRTRDQALPHRLLVSSPALFSVCSMKDLCLELV
ncbi:hypothetical protein BDP55DRAFT_641323 [Colletotrichum godetiae]|uniref:Uncharacterized protein n=1 Tax=Colletotrichum godetiae TaxID=1209918 RepID=A0AAJ0AZW0_9PEZI|nr:uncharacterized protein BDP55DRAFT_641323 [Colletotrichum godetiae]KAK1701359.1 hypothetical protein BDP55DRAFT_641323 [Colletotrichum godetiae]